jgi:hypothetical protein
VSATNVVVSGSLTAPASFSLPYSQITGAPSAYTLPAATTSTLGGVIAPSSGGLTVDGSGNISFNWPYVSPDGNLSFGSTAGSHAYIDDNGHFYTWALGGITLATWYGTATFQQVDTNAPALYLINSNGAGWLALGQDGSSSVAPTLFLDASGCGGNMYWLASYSDGSFGINNNSLSYAKASVLYSNPSGGCDLNDRNAVYAGGGVAVGGDEIAVSNGSGYSTLSGRDDGTTPTNTSTPVGWTHVHVNGVDSWIPYYQ